MTKPGTARPGGMNYLGVSTSLEYGLLAMLMTVVITSALSPVATKFAEAISHIAANI